MGRLLGRGMERPCEEHRVRVVYLRGDPRPSGRKPWLVGLELLVTSYWFKVICPSCLTEMHGQNVLLPRENGFRFSCLGCGWEASYYAADNVTYRFEKGSIGERVEIELR